jgi:hypothetical protein
MSYKNHHSTNVMQKHDLIISSKSQQCQNHETKLTITDVLLDERDDECEEDNIKENDENRLELYDLDTENDEALDKNKNINFVDIIA